ncbi:MAG: DEAD/DEAH box helicase [Acidimicrobiales bacterium]
MSGVDEVAAVLEAAPGRTSGEVRDALRAAGRVSLTTGDVSRILTTNQRRFHHDGGQPPRWWPAAHAVVSPPQGNVPAAAVVALASGAMPPLHAWQVDALGAWRRQGRRGVVEAVTGAGKSIVGVAAVLEEVAARGQACVVVPTTELLRQWAGVLAPKLAQGVSLGLLGDGHAAGLGRVDVLVAVVNSARAADLRPRRPGGLLVADECHRYGSEGNRLVLEARFPRRLGLSATYARADDGHLTWLDPYFGGTCFRLGYRRAIADGVIARVRVALVAAAFEPHERAAYAELSTVMSAARARLVSSDLVPAEPIGLFLEAVARLARSGGDDGAAKVARQYLWAMQDRRRLVSETPAKAAALARLAPAVRSADRAIVFTQSIAGAEEAAAVLRSEGLSAAAVHSALDRSARRSVLDRYAAGDLRAVTAPQVLDEGVDVPAADLGIILAASRSRRQMIQRMGRVLRRKPDGRPARFAVVYVEGTTEDPAQGAHGAFLDEVTGVADAVASFRPGSEAAAVTSFLDTHREPV